MEETFDDLPDGSIVGQGSYPYAGAWALISRTVLTSKAEVGVLSGSDKILSVTNVADASAASNTYYGVTVNNKFGLAGGGHIHFKFRINKDASGYGGRITLLAGSSVSNQPFSVYFRYSTDFQIAFWNGVGTRIMAAAKDTWYTVDAYWGPSGSSGAGVRIFINGSFVYAGITGPFATAHWDMISVSSYSPSGGDSCVLDVNDLKVYSLFPLAYC